MKNKDLIIAKQKELIAETNRFTEFLNESFDIERDDDWQELFDFRLRLVKRFESELSALESEGEKSDLQSLVDEISEWSDKTFGEGQRNPAIVYHLKKEVDELIDFMEGGVVTSKEQNLLLMEYADCLMLLLDSASHSFISMEELLKATREKLEINKNRKWGEPDKNGVIEHIRSEPDKAEEICPVCKTSYLYNGECLNYSCSAYAYRPITNKEAEERKTLDEIIKETPITWDGINPKLNDWAKEIAIKFASQSLPEITEEQLQKIISAEQKAFEPNPTDTFKQGMYSGFAFGFERCYHWYRDEMKMRIK